MSDNGLFSAFQLRGVRFRNRVGVSPMCQYSSQDGLVNDWHLIHLGSRAVGGAGLVIVEATGVTADGRISPGDLGIWSDAHAEGLACCARFIEAQGAVAGIQLGHAGRKASTPPPWEGGGTLAVDQGGWRPLCAPSAVAFDERHAQPEELDEGGIAEIVRAFASGARRAAEAGFRVIELHAAHGYLLHQFLSPLSNRRSDRYGGGFEGRTRLVLEVVDATRAVLPDESALFVRISATDWAEGGWDLEQSVRLSTLLRERGVDLVDCSSGGLVPGVRIPVGPGYQTGFAEEIRRRAGIATAAVGLITDAEQADAIVREGGADMVLLARQMLRDPYWPLHAARRLGQKIQWPVQYLRAAD